MAILLERRKFKQITVNDLCEEALTSRAAFYTHYKDKYDLLESWFFSRLTTSGIPDVIQVVSRLMYDDFKIMRNILYEADSETMEILHKFIRSLMDVFLKKTGTQKIEPEYQMFITFCVGGISELIKSQIKQEETQKYLSLQKYFDDLLKYLLDFGKLQ